MSVLRRSRATEALTKEAFLGSAAKTIAKGVGKGVMGAGKAALKTPTRRKITGGVVGLGIIGGTGLMAAREREGHKAGTPGGAWTKQKTSPSFAQPTDF